MKIKLLLLFATILAVPSLSSAQTVCKIDGSSSTLDVGGSFALSETGSEAATFRCAGATFILPNGGASQTFEIKDDSGAISDRIIVSNGIGGGEAVITFQSDICGTGCVESPGPDTDTPPNISVTTTGGVTLTFTSDDDPTTGSSDLVVAASPEPATFATFGTGLLLVGGLLRRKLGK